MSDKFSHLNILDPNDVMKVNGRPLQSPGRDENLRTATIGGPGSDGLGADRRLFFSVDLLAKLLEIARTSPTRRVQVNRTGLRVDLRRERNGHQYEVWTLIGEPPVAEQLPSAVTSMLHGGAGEKLR